jgi:DNA-binding MarR family transcriptional regulator
MPAPSHRLTKSEYQMLAAFRYQLRRFLQFSEEAAQAAGLTPRQYQALLAIKGSTQRERLTIGELAEQLQIVHHAAVELVDRLSAQNLVERHSSLDDRRKVFVRLSRTGSKVLDKLSAAHRGELRRLSPGLLPLLEKLVLDGEAKQRRRKETSGQRRVRP